MMNFNHHYCFTQRTVETTAALNVTLHIKNNHTHHTKDLFKHNIHECGFLIYVGRVSPPPFVKYLFLCTNPFPYAGCCIFPIVPHPDKPYKTHMSINAITRKQPTMMFIAKLKQRSMMLKIKSKISHIV